MLRDSYFEDAALKGRLYKGWRIWRGRERSGSGAGRAGGVFAPCGEAFAGEAVNGAFVLVDDFEPGERTHLREIDSSETHSRDKNIDAVAEWLVLERTDGMGHGLRTVGIGPAAFHLGVSLGDGHLQGRVRHFEGNEFLPVLGTR